MPATFWRQSMAKQSEKGRAKQVNRQMFWQYFDVIRLFIRMHMMANYQPFVVVVLFYNNNNVFFKQANYVVMLQKEEAFLDLMGYM